MLVFLGYGAMLPIVMLLLKAQIEEIMQRPLPVHVRMTTYLPKT